MELQKNKHYKLKLNLHGRIEEYEGKVLEINSNEFRFETEDDNACRALTLHKKDIIHSKEISAPEKENKTFKISTRKKFTNLKPSDEPDF